LLLKEFIIQNLSASKEERKPTTIKQAAHHKDGKDEPIVRKQYDAKYHKGKERKHDTECLLR
jgi:hypothetical protein